MRKKAHREEKERLQDLIDDCERIADMTSNMKGGSGKELWEIHKKYARIRAPHKAETATLWYKMRLFTLRLWDKKILSREG